MVRVCVVKSCRRSEHRKINPRPRFFVIPSVFSKKDNNFQEQKKRQRALWCKRLQLSGNMATPVYVCDAHFITGIHMVSYLSRISYTTVNCHRKTSQLY
jgi:THAP domain